jgi:hypothetical protein
MIKTEVQKMVSKRTKIANEYNIVAGSGMLKSCFFPEFYQPSRTLVDKFLPTNTWPLESFVCKFRPKRFHKIALFIHPLC